MKVLTLRKRFGSYGEESERLGAMIPQECGIMDDSETCQAFTA